MAVYYKWIKGCQTTADLDKGLWTYFTWGKSNSSNLPVDGESISTAGVHIMPSLKVRVGKNDTNSDSATRDLGNFLTSKMPAPTIFSEFNFKSRIYLTDPADTSYTLEDLNSAEILKSHRGGIYLADSRFIIEAFNKMDASNTGNVSAYTDLLLHSKYSLFTGTQYLGVDQSDTERTSSSFGKWRIQVNEYLDGTATSTTLPDGIITRGSVKIRTGQSTDLYNNLYVEGGIYLGTQFDSDGKTKTNAVTATFPAFGDTTGNINFYKPLVVHDKPVEAQYFNATSDRRAKENIQPATYSALQLVNKLPIYNFNYKNNTEVVTGILAQDLLAVQPAELDLVSNTNATGENGDYMSIKNDKLMFVLMKAIQELQEELIKLKSEIDELTKVQ